MSQQKLMSWHNLCSGSFEGFDFIHFITQPNFNLQNNSSRLLNLLVDESQDGTIHCFLKEEVWNYNHSLKFSKLSNVEQGANAVTSTTVTLLWTFKTSFLWFKKFFHEKHLSLFYKQMSLPEKRPLRIKKEHSKHLFDDLW